MNHDLIIQELRRLTGQLNAHLGDFSETEIFSLTGVLADLAPLFQKFYPTGQPTLQKKDPENLADTDPELDRLVWENRQQKALLDAIFAADPAGLAVVTGPDLRFVFSNPAYRYICPLLGI